VFNCCDCMLAASKVWAGIASVSRLYLDRAQRLAASKVWAAAAIRK